MTYWFAKELPDIGIVRHAAAHHDEDLFFFFQAEDGIRDYKVTGFQTCALPIFSELGDFVEVPVRTYSSGMLVRLGFSIAAHLDAEVMLIDEVLAVGDEAFQRKCLTRISERIRSEERRVGKECRSRWSRDHLKKR